MNTKATKIILGTVQFGLDYGVNNKNGKPNKDEVKKILDLAYENGINMLDTAEAYGNAHQVIGDYHTSGKNRFDVITKYSALRNDLPHNVSERIMNNIRQMKVDSLYAYMFHSFGDLKTYFPGFRDELLKLKKTGSIKQIGVSIYTNQEADELLNYSDIDLVQLPFNLLDNNSQRRSIFEKLKKKGMEIHTRSVFLQGLFFMDSEALPAQLVVLKPYLDQVKNIALKNNLSLNDLALNYALSQLMIDKVLMGVDSRSQLEENLSSITKANVEYSHIDGIHVAETDLLNPAKWKA
jgi:aryl-alcohol dehydrogenase-like predicted oxidoreductase